MSKRKYELTGRKISYLTVISYDKTKYKWKCLCDCGKETYREGFFLVRRPNGKKSCGCKHFAHGNRMPDNQAAKNKTLNSYKTGAERRNLPFILSKDEFFDLINKNCFYCNAEPSTKCNAVGYENDFLYNGVDRVNNEIGYTKENCVACCKFCNYSKSNLPLNEWKERIKTLYTNLILKDVALSYLS